MVPKPRGNLSSIYLPEELRRLTADAPETPGHRQRPQAKPDRSGFPVELRREGVIGESLTQDHIARR